LQNNHLPKKELLSIIYFIIIDLNFFIITELLEPECMRLLHWSTPKVKISHLVYSELENMLSDHSVKTRTIIEKIMFQLIPENEWIDLDINKMRIKFCCEYSACFGKYCVYFMIV
jgi:hypothetical protein